MRDDYWTLAIVDFGFVEYYSFHYDISLMRSRIGISLVDLFVSTTFFGSQKA